jgi:hypothetical protein
MHAAKQFLSITLAAIFAITALGMSTSAQQRPYRISERENIDRLMRRIESRSAQFRQSLFSALDRSTIDGTRREDNINEFVGNFETATRNLRDRFRQGRDVQGDVSAVLTQAASIDRFMGRQRLAPAVEQDWSALRSDLDALAGYYSVAWRWDGGPAGNNGGAWSNNRGGWSSVGRGSAASLLTGTYRIDPSRSDRVGRAAKIATRDLSIEQQQRVREMLSRRLEAPEMLAIERRGRTVTIASSRAPQVTVEADGRDRLEQTPRGHNIRVNASLSRDQLIISSTGDRGNDYSVTFEALNNGRQLRVTRRIDTESLTVPVTVSSYYDQVSEVAQLDIYREDSAVGRDTRGRTPLGDSTPLIATLDNTLTTRQARTGDRFTLTVQSPPAYSGAVIEGYVSRIDRSGRVSGRSELALNFDRIRMRGGAVRSFDGYIEGVRTPNGEDVRVDNEGVVSEDDSQTTRTVTRTGIGAAIGALIGAVAGGGKGAAIGAAVGGGTGAGSVFVQGRDDLDLIRGSEFTIRATSPNRETSPDR